MMGCGIENRRLLIVFFLQAEDGIRDLVRSRGLGDVYKRQPLAGPAAPAPGLRRADGRGEHGARLDELPLERGEVVALHERPPRGELAGEEVEEGGRRGIQGLDRGGQVGGLGGEAVSGGIGCGVWGGGGPGGARERVRQAPSAH